jgi:hypothetical protein
MADFSRALERDAYAWLNDAARKATARIMNDLAEAGPEWSGEFKDSWVASAPSGGIGGGQYPYSASSLPRIPPTKREAQRVTKYVIENIAPHAPIALDLVSVPRESFTYPGSPPQGDVVARGSRPEKGKRGDLSAGSGNATSTAPLDWYVTYARGGKMSKALERGVRLAKPQ